MATSSKEKLIEIIKNNPTLTAKEIYSLYKNDINKEYQSNIDEKYKVLCNIGQTFHFIDNGYKYYIKINSFDDLGCYIDFVLFDNHKIEMNYNIYHPYKFFSNVELIKIKGELFFEKWDLFSDFFLKLCNLKNNGANIDFTEVPNQSPNFFKFIKNNPDILGNKIIELYIQYCNNSINKKNEIIKNNFKLLKVGMTLSIFNNNIIKITELNDEMISFDRIQTFDDSFHSLVEKVNITLDKFPSNNCMLLNVDFDDILNEYKTITS